MPPILPMDRYNDLADRFAAAFSVALQPALTASGRVLTVGISAFHLPASGASFPYMIFNVRRGSYGQISDGLQNLPQTADVLLITGHVTSNYEGVNDEDARRYIALIENYFSKPYNRSMRAGAFADEQARYIGAMGVTLQTHNGLASFDNMGAGVRQIGTLFNFALDILLDGS